MKKWYIDMTFLEKVKELLTLFENWLSEPEDRTQIQQWVESANALAYSFEFAEEEQVHVDRIIAMFEEQCNMKCKNRAHMPPIEEDRPSMEYIEELIQRKQTEQRTPEWYAQMATIISASEISQLFSSPRQRAKLVVSKTVPYPSRNQSLAVPSDHMSAFDWGIRFEPVVKQIYEYKYKTIIKELGRLTHRTDPRCSASPDGLIYYCPKQERTGRLVEIKCPVTREIDGSIPKEYYNQMQLQLHVTGLKECDYVEAVFASAYNFMEQKQGPGEYNGIIALVRYAEVKNGQDFYYVYSPVNVDAEWTPDLAEGEDCVELIPWRLFQWSEQVVQRSEEWWTSIQPMIDAFWKDVERAKQGDFVIPESTRAPKRKKEEVCQIIFHKLNEHGEVEGSPVKKACTTELTAVTAVTIDL